MMKLQDLNYFLRIASTGHVGRAASALGLTQPALTQSIARLERELNAPLFERTPKGVRLTSFGEHVARHAQRLRTAMDDAQRELNELATGSTGQIRIGTGLAMAQYLVPIACTRLLNQSPGVTLSITAGTGKSLLPELLEGRIDIILSGVPLEPEPGISNEPIMEDHVVVVARHSHPLRRRRLTPAALSHARWALPKSGSLSTNWLARRFRELGADPPAPEVETDSISTLLAMVAESDLLTFQSWSSIQRSPLHAAIRPLEVPSINWRRRIGVRYRAGGYLPAAGRDLIKILKALSSAEKA